MKKEKDPLDEILYPNKNNKSGCFSILMIAVSFFLILKRNSI